MSSLWTTDGPAPLSIVRDPVSVVIVGRNLVGLPVLRFVVEQHHGVFFLRYPLETSHRAFNDNGINARWYLSDAFVVGLGLKWGRWPQIVAIPVALVLVVIGLVAHENIWAPPLAWGVFIMIQFWYGFIGPSFILGGLFAVPG